MKYFSVLLFAIISMTSARAADTPPISDEPVEYVVSSPVPTAFKPDDAAIENVIRNFDIFENFMGSGQFQKAYAMFTEGNRATAPFEQWRMAQTADLEKYGPDISRQLYRLTWYPNSPTAPQPGLYVAVDFASRTQSGGFRCGYLVLYVAGSAEMQITRSDHTQVPKDLVDGKLPRKDVLQKLPCYLGKAIRTAFPATDS